jgi:hypothetical protein
MQAVVVNVNGVTTSHQQGDGTWTLADNTWPLAERLYHYRDCTDLAGNVGTDTGTITIDLTPPNAP